MQKIILGFYLFIALCLIGVILTQKSPGIAIQAKNTFTGPRSRANILTRLTGFLALIFMSLCVLLTRMQVENHKEKTRLIQAEKDKK